DRGREFVPQEARRELVVRAVVVLGGEAELLEVVLAAHAVGGLADLLHRGQKQADQDRDDGNHHQQLDQREAGPARRRSHWYPSKDATRTSRKAGDRTTGGTPSR